MTHLIFESHYNKDILHAVTENNTKADMQMFTQFPWRWLRWLSVKPRSDCQVESSVPASEQKECQDRIHQKCDVPYSYETGSDIKLVASEGDDESFVPRKGMLLRGILWTIEVGMERQELKQTFWNDSYLKTVKQNNMIDTANMVYKFGGTLQCVKAGR